MIDRSIVQSIDRTLRPFRKKAFFVVRWCKQRQGHICLAVLLASWTFHLKAVTSWTDGAGLSGDVASWETIARIEFSVLTMPTIMTVFCTMVPLYKFGNRVHRRSQGYRFGQEFRDVAQLLCRQTNNELNTFFTKLNEEDQSSLKNGLNIIHAGMSKEI